MINKLNCSIKSFTHIIQIADIHIKLLERHDEYCEMFDKFYAEVEKTPTSTLICIVGDLFHNKLDLNPECIQIAKNFLASCAKLRPTVLIAGNHDLNVANKNRLDSLSPVVYHYYNAKYSDPLNNSFILQQIYCENLYYIKNSGLYTIGDILFSLCSVFDPENFINYENIPPIYKNEYRHHIALYHGVVDGIMLDTGYVLTNKNVKINTFDKFHITLLGDIHKAMDLQSYDFNTLKPAVRYCGSLIQQTFAEEHYKNGFSLWDLKQKTYKHIQLLNDYGFFTVEVNKGKLLTDLSNISAKSTVRIKYSDSTSSEIKKVAEIIKSKGVVKNISSISETSANPSIKQTNTIINLTDITNLTYQNKLITDYLIDICKIQDKSLIESIISINSETNNAIDKDKFAKNIKWKPKKLEFSNLFSYGENNVIDFSKCKDTMGLFAPNASGKSSIFSILCFCLFDKNDRGYKASHLLNFQKTNFKCKFNFEINGVDFFIEKRGLADKKGNVKVDVKFWKVEKGTTVDLQGEARRNTNDIIKDYVGTYEDFILTALSVQNGKNAISFIDMGQSERKDLLSQFIGLSIFDKLLEISSDKSKEISTSLKLLKKDETKNKLVLYENELSSLTCVYNDEHENLSNLIEEKNILNENILTETKKLKQVDTKIVDINQVNAFISRKKTESDKNETEKVSGLYKCNVIAKELGSVYDIIKNFEDKRIVDTFKLYQKFKIEFSDIDKKLELKKIEVKNKIEKKKMLDTHEYDPNCKYCVNSIFVKDATNIAKQLEVDKIEVKQLLTTWNNQKEQLKSLEWVAVSYDDYTKQLLLSNKLKDDLVNQQNLVSKIEKSNLVIKSELEKLQNEIGIYNKQIDDIEFNKNIQNSINRLQQEFKNQSFIVDQKNKNVVTMYSRITLLKNQIEELNKILENINKLELQYDAYSYYIKAVNRDGIPYIVISNTVPEVEKEVNNILSHIVNFTIKFETDGKNIVPYIVYDDKKWPIEMASGFEKFISSLAIRVGLINISNLPRPNFIAIDEGWGTLDAENLQQVKFLFDSLKTNFEFIIIISHLDSIRDFVDNHIEIKKDNGFSTINFV